MHDYCWFSDVFIFKNEIFLSFLYTLVLCIKQGIILSTLLSSWIRVLFLRKRKNDKLYRAFVYSENMKRIMAVGSRSDFSDTHYPLPCWSLQLPLSGWVVGTVLFLSNEFIMSLPTHFNNSSQGYFPSCVQFPVWWHFCFLINSRESSWTLKAFPGHFRSLCSSTCYLEGVWLGSYLDLSMFGELFAEMWVGDSDNPTIYRIPFLPLHFNFRGFFFELKQNFIT